MNNHVNFNKFYWFKDQWRQNSCLWLVTYDTLTVILDNAPSSGSTRFHSKRLFFLCIWCKIRNVNTVYWLIIKLSSHLAAFGTKIDSTSIIIGEHRANRPKYTLIHISLRLYTCHSFISNWTLPNSKLVYLHPRNLFESFFDIINFFIPPTRIGQK